MLPNKKASAGMDEKISEVFWSTQVGRLIILVNQTIGEIP
jgi:hypothetical protein